MAGGVVGSDRALRWGSSAFKKYCMLRIEALNHALRNIPEDLVRYHLCWGSWHGPHASDLPLADIVDVMLAVKAKFLSRSKRPTSGTSTVPPVGTRAACRRARSSCPAS